MNFKSLTIPEGNVVEISINGLTIWEKPEFYTEGLVFTLRNNDTEYEVSDYTGTDVDIVVPSKYNGKLVTSIGNWAFAECKSLASITFGENSQLTSIGDDAFFWCSSLKTIEIPNSVETIGNNAFNTCAQLTSIVIPNSVTSIGSSAFSGCRFTNIIFDENSQLTSIGDYAFCGSILQETFVIPNSVTSIGEKAFYGCNFTNVIIGNSIETIGNNAFEDCFLLTNINIPESVTSIGYSVFRGCESLTIYCEANSKPSGWHENWNSSDCPVVWGYKGDTQTLLGTTWRLKDMINCREDIIVCDTIYLQYNISFSTRDGKHCEAIIFHDLPDFGNGRVAFTGNDIFFDIANSIDGVYCSEDERVITITGGSDIDNIEFIKWLQENAVFQSEPQLDKFVISAGDYVFNETLTSYSRNEPDENYSHTYSIYFENHFVSNSKTYFELGTEPRGYTGENFDALSYASYDENTGVIRTIANKSTTGWVNEAYRTIKINTDIEVDEALYYWFNENTSQLISFTIDGTIYQAKESMTWEQWLESEYNVNNYSVLLLNGIVTVVLREDDGMHAYGLSYNDVFIPITDTIVKDRAYVEKLGTNIGGSN